MRGRVLLGVVALLAVGPGGVAAQEDTTNTIDRIVAVVGTKAILASQVTERFRVELQGRPAPTDPKALQGIYANILRSMVDEELVVQAALQDTVIKVTDEEVTQSVDELYRNVRRQLGSDEKFRNELKDTGFQTLEEWRSFVSDQQRRKFLYDRYWTRLQQEQKVKDLPPTDAEIRQYFDQNKGSFPPRPEAISFKQIVMTPRARDSAKAVARRLADSILIELRKGGDFAAAARRFSMDPGSKEQGGSLNWVRRGQGLEAAFEAAAFGLRVGQISDPVETSFGYHLIQVERVQPAEVSVRHILISPVIDSVDADSARQTAEAVYRALKSGASFDSLQRLHHDRTEEREAEQFPLDRLAQVEPAYGENLRDVKEGELTPLFRRESAEPNRAKWTVVLVTRRIPAGEVRFEDVRDRIRTELGRILGRRKYLETLRQANFVEIRSS